jgi:hypothetical protein
MRPLSPSAVRASRLNWRVTAWAIVVAVVSVFVLANAHLAYVAFASQPDCPLQRDVPAAGAEIYRAASPAC